MNGSRIAIVAAIALGATVGSALPQPVSKHTAQRINEQKSEGLMNQQVSEFFMRYEKANSSSDTSAIGSLYAKTFMFGGPKGVQAVKREDFLKVVPKMKAYYGSMGISDTALHSVDTRPLDSRYLLATVVWRIRFRDSPEKYVDAAATYILSCEAGALSVVFQLDHQDLASVVRDLQGRQ